MSVLPEERVFSTLHTVALAVQVLQEHGVAAEALLCGSGIAPADLQTPTRLVSHAQELQVLRNALQLSGDPTLGLQLGRRMRVSAYGMLGYTLLSSRTLGDALELLISQAAILGSYFQLQLQPRGDEVRLCASGYRYAAELERFNVELCLASLLSVIQDLLGERRPPRALLLAYPAPAHQPHYHDSFACRPSFDADCNALCLPADWLQQPLPLADPVSHQHGLQHCQQLQAQLHGRDDLCALIRQQLHDDLPGCSRFDQLAARLHRSERTLRRHLQQQGSSFQALLDEVRHAKARQLLLHSDLPVYLIAEQLGYSETASFRHAFQRWSGQSPSALRR